MCCTSVTWLSRPSCNTLFSSFHVYRFLDEAHTVLRRTFSGALQNSPWKITQVKDASNNVQKLACLRSAYPLCGHLTHLTQNVRLPSVVLLRSARELHS